LRNQKDSLVSRVTAMSEVLLAV